jgi:hypothetical protein
MQSYETDGPITASVHLGAVVGNVRLTTADDGRVTVDVRPVDPTSKNDVKVAEQTRVDWSDGRLTVTGPKISVLFGRPGGVNVELSLPPGSTLEGSSGMGEVTCVGHLATCRFKTGYGTLHVDDADSVAIKTGMGDVTIERMGEGEVTSSSGEVRLHRIEGAAAIKNSNGVTWIGEAAGDLRVAGANGNIAVERALAGVTATTANGSIRVGEVVRGSVTLETASGGLEVGVRPGTAVWLDLNTVAGRVTNELDDTSGPGDAIDTVEVRARTYVGNIVVRRALVDAS